MAERSYQQARQYSLERQQGRAVGAEPGTTAAIVEHADVRRMLMTMKASIEAMRCVLYLNAVSIDRASISDDPRHEEMVQLLTPISKAWSTDLGMEVTSTGIQIYGGMGFVEETGIAQHFRDLRIGPIYEGTNGIQAIDLVGRKITMRNGDVMRELVGEMRSEADLVSGRMGEALRGAADALSAATESMLDNEMSDRLAGATSYLSLLGYAVGGWLMVRSARLAGEMPDNPFAQNKIATAEFYCQHLLSRVHGLVASSMATADDVFGVSVDQL